MYTFAIAIRSPFYPVLEKVLSVFFLNHFDSQTDLRLEKYNHTAEPNKLVYVHKRKPVSVLYNCQLQQSPFPLSPPLSPSLSILILPLSSPFQLHPPVPNLLVGQASSSVLCVSLWMAVVCSRTWFISFKLQGCVWNAGQKIICSKQRMMEKTCLMYQWEPCVVEL